ncbi:MAG: GIY-YIG nuclease family protein [Lachnospiraceae bacterium]
MGLFDIFNISKLKQENELLKFKNEELTTRMDALGITEYCQAKQRMNDLERETNAKLDETNRQIVSNNNTINELRSEIDDLQIRHDKLSKSLSNQERKLSRCKELYKSIDYAICNFFQSDTQYTNCRIDKKDFEDAELIAPSVILKLHCMDVKSLRKAYKENEKQIDKLLEQYSARYTTKANKSIYNLMVIALRAELQNILYNLKYEKLDKSIEDVKTVSAKYLKIAGEGNQSIAGTLTKFIGELEYLFINAVKIEYNYYVKKEQARQEQLAIKEQMRQEAEERKALEAERKKIEQEESKYESQISSLTEQAASAEGSELEALKARILELQAQLADVVVKKEEISNLQNGKAGNVYIISNLGSFGENVFKIGMTRRLDPQERVNELGDASVPFKFDVHSFIFSDDASNLETELHKRLNNKRVNKVNMRKEFFYTTVDDLEVLVNEICPTAEFNKTMLAEEFRQSQSTNENYSSEFIITDTDSDSDEE